MQQSHVLSHKRRHPVWVVKTQQSGVARMGFYEGCVGMCAKLCEGRSNSAKAGLVIWTSPSIERSHHQFPGLPQNCPKIILTKSCSHRKKKRRRIVNLVTARCSKSIVWRLHLWMDQLLHTLGWLRNILCNALGGTHRDEYKCERVCKNDWQVLQLEKALSVFGSRFCDSYTKL